MCLAEDNDVVQALAPDRSDQPLGKAILPGRGWCNWLISDAPGAKSACDNGAVDPIAVPDHVTRSTVPRKCLGDLARNPFRGRMCCDADPDQLSAINPYNHEAIQQFEANGRDHEQIRGGNVRSVVSQAQQIRRWARPGHPISGRSFLLSPTGVPVRNVTPARGDGGLNSFWVRRAVPEFSQDQALRNFSSIVSRRPMSLEYSAIGWGRPTR